MRVPGGPQRGSQGAAVGPRGSRGGPQGAREVLRDARGGQEGHFWQELILAGRTHRRSGTI